ncbi:hypothetical protein CEXT_188941 [Caerostris extrusa]|uniref:Secreted protein n=1 Tax=Caerostris extrusa TaxID=172846 RepID=A0AAV4NQF9_CAEEX|nr:hypothetical protein CEXT_188941 [Caerostris extrusa]
MIKSAQLKHKKKRRLCSLSMTLSPFAGRGVAANDHFHHQTKTLNPPTSPAGVQELAAARAVKGSTAPSTSRYSFVIRLPPPLFLACRRSIVSR